MNTGLNSTVLSKFKMIDNYIYFYHTDTLIIIPEFADSISDSISINYSQSPMLTRTAPIYSYANSGPRTIDFQLELHRDMMTDINQGNIKLQGSTDLTGEEYLDVVDTFIKQIQGAVLPSYTSATKLVNPPLVALRMGDDIFIKGVITSAIGLTYKAPIIPGRNADGTQNESKNRYSTVAVSFNIAEVDPYDAETVMTQGGFRGLSTTLENRIYTLMHEGSN